MRIKLRRRPLYNILSKTYEIIKWVCEAVQTILENQHGLRVVTERLGHLVSQAAVSHRGTWMTVRGTQPSCMQVLELGEVTRRLRRLLRCMVIEARRQKPISASHKVVSIHHHSACFRRDFRAVWALYKECMAEYCAMYDAYLFCLENGRNLHSHYTEN